MIRPGVLAAALLLLPWPCVAAGFTPSPLAVAHLSDEAEPRLLLAQRSIEREWGPADQDSEYVTVEASGWRSPGLALSLSGLVPGAGHLYAGERSGWAYAAVEVAGWVAYLIFRERGHDRIDQAESYAGSPADTSSNWSFERYREATGQSTADLEALYNADRAAFYQRIGSDDRYLAGWKGSPSQTRDQFWTQRESGEDQLERARFSSEVLWLNHILSAFDALRAARIRNLPIERNLELKMKTGWRGGGPSVALVLQKTF